MTTSELDKLQDRFYIPITVQSNSCYRSFDSTRRMTVKTNLCVSDDIPDDLTRYYPGSEESRVFAVLNIGYAKETCPRITCSITNNSILWSSKVQGNLSGNRLNIYDAIGVSIDDVEERSVASIRLHMYPLKLSRSMRPDDREYFPVDLFFDTSDDAIFAHALFTQLIRRAPLPVLPVPNSFAKMLHKNGSAEAQASLFLSADKLTNDGTQQSETDTLLTASPSPSTTNRNTVGEAADTQASFITIAPSSSLALSPTSKTIIPKDMIPSPRRSILFIVNPVGGPGEARTIARALAPMLQRSVHAHAFYETSFAGDCHALLSSPVRVPQGRFDTIVVISGDGLLYEVLNGVMARPDWSTFVHSIRFAHVPAGSGNGLAASVSNISEEPEACPTAATFLALKGHSRRVDVMSVTQPGLPALYGFLSISWAMVSDADFESEKWRWCGGARFTASALQRILCLRKYTAQMQFLRVERDRPENVVNSTEQGQDCGSTDDDGTTIKPQLRCLPACPTCEPSDVGTEFARFKQFVHSVQVTQDVTSRPSAPKMNEDATPSTDGGLMEITADSSTYQTSSIFAPDNEKWEVVDADDVTLIWGMNVTHAAKGMYTAPRCHLGTGFIDVFYTRNIGCCKLLGLMTAIETGSHLNDESVNHLAVKGFRLDPTLANRECIISLDGERIPHAPIEVRVWRKIINLVCK